MEKTTLNSVGEWAQARIDSGEEPPWTLRKLQLLADLVQEFSSGFDASKPFCPGLDEKSDMEFEVKPDNVVNFAQRASEDPDPLDLLPH